jgi:oxazoline/thiazoline dehydrogenase
MNNLINLSYRPDIKVIVKDDTEFTVSNGVISRQFSNLSSGMMEAFNMLKNENGIPENTMLDLVIEKSGFESLMSFTYILKTIEDLGFISYQLILKENLSVSLVPLSSHFNLVKFKPKEETTYKLSKFTLIRHVEDHFEFESPLGYAKIQFTEPAIAPLILALYQPFTITSFSNQFPDYQANILKKIVDFLFQLRCLEEIDEQGNIPEEDLEKPLAYWEFHDLYYHTRSRMGRHNNAYGGTFPFGNKAKIPSPFKEIESEKRINLSIPDIEKLRLEDISLTTAIEDRSSIRNHSDKIITAEKLGYFLYRTSRINRTRDEHGYTLIQKPYPSGGGLYELEVYVIVNKCEDVEKGLYYYDPKNHQLCLLKQEDANVDLMVSLAKQTVDSESEPHLVLLITSRFQRLSHKYRAVTYSLILKHVGVLYQTMYLVAKSMGLAPCGMGGSESDLFAVATGIDYLEESQVGEFSLGNA